MVNSISHLGVGLLIALALGFKGKKRNILAFLSILPDLDFIPYSLFVLASNSVSHEARNQLFYLSGHREFLHSILFILIVTFFIYIKTKDRLFTTAGFAAIFSHVYLDYATNWKMRPLYPFSTDASIMGSISFLDPLANVLPLLPVFIVLIAYMKSRGKWNGKFNKFCTFVTNNRKRFYTALLIVLIVWLIVTPITKFFLLDHISETEGKVISYQDTYPTSFGKFLTAYQYNSTHYKILDLSYWPGIERSEYIRKTNVSGNVSNAFAYAERVEKLYSTAVPEEIDYPVYNVSEENSYVTVVLSDARDPYVKSWAYFKTAYRFVFDEKSGDYVAYAGMQGRKEKRLGKNYFSDQ